MNFLQPVGENIFFSWEQLYNQLLFSYYQLSQNYRTAVNKNTELLQELKLRNQIFAQTEKLHSSKQLKIVTKKTFEEQSPLQEETIKEHDKIQIVTKPIKKRRNHRKPKNNTSNQYNCSYPDCNRCYDSSVSLNLHIKLKHNGGTKKQRQTYAKMIIDAEEKGQQVPKININFPPNFVEVYEEIQHVNSQSNEN